MIAVDRITTDIVRCEDLESGETFLVEKNQFPESIKEGDIFEKTKEGYVLRNEIKINREQELQKRLHRLFKRS